MTESKKLNFRKLLLLPAVMAGGLLYYVFMCMTHLRIPCVFHEITGLYCPGCGATRMADSLIHLDLHGAFGYNQLLFLSLPLIVYLLTCAYLQYAGLKVNDNLKKTNEYITWGLVAVFVIFGILRNLI
jgi:hypothetical protein